MLATVVNARKFHFHGLLQLEAPCGTGQAGRPLVVAELLRILAQVYQAFEDQLSRRTVNPLLLICATVPVKRVLPSLVIRLR